MHWQLRQFKFSEIFVGGTVTATTAVSRIVVHLYILSIGTTRAVMSHGVSLTTACHGGRYTGRCSLRVDRTDHAMCDPRLTL
eukprot:227811-Rhodomonas_salina.1